MKGPLEGGGVLVWFSASGVLGGIGAANMSASRLLNVPEGFSSAMVMSPVPSSVVMPLMVGALPSA